MPASEPLVRLHAVTKDYHGLRPLRVNHLELHAGQTLALLGFDQATTELLVNLIIGAILPDAGEVRAMGQRTSEITDAEAWVGTLDQFGLISERAVMLDQLTVEQNLAVPFSLELDDLSLDVRSRVRHLAGEVGVADVLAQPLASTPSAVRVRVRLGRALALNPRVLLAEHPNATLGRDDAASFAGELSRIVAARGTASLVITADEAFARAVAADILTLQPATGELKKASGWRHWF